VFFWGFDPLDETQYQPILQKFHLLIIVVPEKLPGEKRCDEEAEEEEEKEHEFLGVFDVF